MLGLRCHIFSLLVLIYFVFCIIVMIDGTVRGFEKVFVAEDDFQTEQEYHSKNHNPALVNKCCSFSFWFLFWIKSLKNLLRYHSESIRVTINLINCQITPSSNF